jgi:hypothetical protein
MKYTSRTGQIEMLKVHTYIGWEINGTSAKKKAYPEINFILTYRTRESPVSCGLLSNS